MGICGQDGLLCDSPDERACFAASEQLLAHFTAALKHQYQAGFALFHFINGEKIFGTLISFHMQLITVAVFPYMFWFNWHFLNLHF